MEIQLQTLPILELDHPGAQDEGYKKRRAVITQKARDFHTQRGTEIPEVEYLDVEHQVWQHINRELAPLHAKWACSIYKEGRKLLGLNEKRIPQLAEVSRKLQATNGFTLEPVHGLVDARIFLMKLEQKTMLCTQYIRHHSKPEFTPEPDVVHEVLGHVPLWLNKELVEFSQLVGRAARLASEEEVKWLSNLYWFTIEFGLIQEGNEVKALGAGLLGGIKDLTNAMTGRAVLKPFNMQEVINRDYNYSFEQDVFFVLPSLQFLLRETRKLIAGFQTCT